MDDVTAGSVDLKADCGVIRTLVPAPGCAGTEVTAGFAKVVAAVVVAGCVDEVVGGGLKAGAPPDATTVWARQPALEVPGARQAPAGTSRMWATPTAALASTASPTAAMPASAFKVGLGNRIMSLSNRLPVACGPA